MIPYLNEESETVTQEELDAHRKKYFPKMPYDPEYDYKPSTKEFLGCVKEAVKAIDGQGKYLWLPDYPKISHYRDWADSIAKNPTVYTITPQLLRTADDAIFCRLKHAENILGRADYNPEMAESHQAFVDMLKYVRAVLGKVYKSEKEKKGQATRTLDDYFQQLNEVRQHIVTTFASHEANPKHTTLSLASTVAEMGFHLMRQAHHDLLTEYPCYDDHLRVNSLSGMDGLGNDVKTISEAALLSVDGWTNIVNMDFTDPLCNAAVPALIRLDREWATVFGPRRSSQRMRFEVDAILVDGPRNRLLQTLLAQIRMLRNTPTKSADVWQRKQNLNAGDALVSGIWNAFTNQLKPLPSWLLIAFTTMAEVYSMSDLSRAVTKVDVEYGGSHLAGTIKRFQALRQETPIWRILGSPGDFHIIRDPLRHWVDLMQVNDSTQDAGTSQATCPLLSVNPLVHLNRLRHAVADSGLDAINHSTVVIAIMGLYRAVQDSRIVTSSWHDLEFFLRHHIVERSTRRAQSDEQQESLSEWSPYYVAEHFRRLLGCPVRVLDGHVPVLPIPTTNIKHVSKFALPQAFDNPAKIALLSAANSWEISVALQPQRGHDLPRFWPRYGDFQRSPVQQLRHVEGMFRAEEPILLFDRLGFLEQCARCLTHLMEYSRSCISQEVFATFEHAYQWVDHILVEAAQHTAESKPLTGTTLIQIAFELEKWYKVNGKTLSEYAHTSSSSSSSSSRASNPGEDATDSSPGAHCSTPATSSLRQRLDGSVMEVLRSFDRNVKDVGWIKPYG